MIRSRKKCFVQMVRCIGSEKLRVQTEDEVSCQMKFQVCISPGSARPRTREAVGVPYVNKGKN